MSLTELRTAEEMADGAHAVERDWVNLAEMEVALREEELPVGVRTGLIDGFLACDRSLIMFLCGGQRGARDSRDITPRDFLGRDWWPEDEEMDQRLRGRLAVMARLKAHLSWERVTNADIVMWPFSLLAWETTWAMQCFVRAVEQADRSMTSIFRGGEDRVLRTLGDRPTWRASTNEYGHPRPGQVDRTRR